MEAGCMPPEAVSNQEPAGSSQDDTIEKIVYRISFVDGSELNLELSPSATVRDLYETVSSVRALPSSRLQLIPAGHTAPVKRSLEKLLEVETKEFLAVASRHMELGHGAFPEGSVVDASFEHYPATAYTGEEPPVGDGAELEAVQGKTVTVGTACRRELPPYGDPCGVMFNCFESEEAPPLAGKVLLRFLVHQHGYAAGFGVGTKDMSVSNDPEHQRGFFGIYHGGSSRNCCGNAKRYARGKFVRGKPDQKWQDEQIAILIDVEARTMQCFDGLVPFGPLYTELPEEPLWPVVVLWTGRDSVSLSISSA